MKKYILFLMLLGGLVSCQDTTNRNDCNELYFSSFENAEDFDTFIGNGFYKEDEAPSMAGDSALVVSGGCIGPHLYFDIGPYINNKEISIEFMAKTDLGGDVSIYSTTDSSNKVNIAVRDLVWTAYKTEELLLLNANEILRVDFFSGGDAQSNTFIDLFTICDVTK